MQRGEGLNRDFLNLLSSGKSIRVYTVSELTAEIKGKLEQAFPVVWVAGEISNVRRPASGHVYLTLKDERAQIALVIWRAIAAAIPFEIRDGMAVIVQGELTVYPPQGQYQISCRQLFPKGVGALELAFRQLKEKLLKQGLFAPERKRPIPFLPRRIGIVTSRSGAALRDMLKVLSKRCPFVPVLICPTRVQGEGAAQEIAAAIADMNRMEEVDVLIVGRGGGSLEDLWAFNEEVVARAIFHSRIPVVSAVGHEVDVTIADFVADMRALTPTDAAQRVVPDREQLIEHLHSLRTRLAQATRRKLSRAREAILAIARSYAFRQPLELIRREERRLDDFCEQFAQAGRRLLPDRRHALDVLSTRLEALGPRNVLARGYSITMLEKNGKIVRQATQVSPGDALRTVLGDGSIRSTIESTSAGENNGSKKQREV